MHFLTLQLLKWFYQIVKYISSLYNIDPKDHSITSDPFYIEKNYAAYSLNVKYWQWFVLIAY